MINGKFYKESNKHLDSIRELNDEELQSITGGKINGKYLTGGIITGIFGTLAVAFSPGLIWWGANIIGSRVHQSGYRHKQHI